MRKHLDKDSIYPLAMIVIAILFLLNAWGSISPDAVAVGWPIVLGIAGIIRLRA